MQGKPTTLQKSEKAPVGPVRGFFPPKRCLRGAFVGKPDLGNFLL